MAPSLALRWTRRSLADLSRILEYISRDNPAAATALAQAIRARAENLRRHPNLGRAVFHSEQRELVVHRNYLLTYRIKEGEVQILQVWHTARKR